MRSSTAQKAGSSATEVAWPASNTDRFRRPAPLSGRDLRVMVDKDAPNSREIIPERGPTYAFEGLDGRGELSQTCIWGRSLEANLGGNA